MAQFLIGKVFYQDRFAGYLREESGDRTSFQYDESYLASNPRPLSYTLPLHEKPQIYLNGLHPFFDNLVAEGWLENAQMRLLGKRITSRFELLLAFGFDCAGAVSVLDPEPSMISNIMIDCLDQKELALLSNRASLSGVQPKITLVKQGRKFRPSKINELSSYIAKFPSSLHPDIIENEFLTLTAFQKLLPQDQIVEFKMDTIQGFSEPVLIVKRFDRLSDGSRVHFEEFNQILGLKSKSKYDTSYESLAEILLDIQTGPQAELYRLFLRILAGFLVGNTDMHSKNFAVFHAPEGLVLTPSYDQVCATLYKYKNLALNISGANDLALGDLKPKHIFHLAEKFLINRPVLKMCLEQLDKNVPSAIEAILASEIGSKTLKEKIVKVMKARWNGTFKIIRP
jgi:serine/threonine-protein kinase HipA